MLVEYATLRNMDALVNVDLFRLLVPSVIPVQKGSNVAAC